jgi:hypothetical protein
MVTRLRPQFGSYLRTSILVTVVACAITQTACSNQGSPERAAADAAIPLEISSSGIAFQNKTGMPLTSVTLAILPYGPGGEFTRRLSRIENTIKREVPLGEFRGRDGTPLNLRVTRPKSVRLEAEDATGKKYEVEVPWK